MIRVYSIIIFVCFLSANSFAQSKVTKGKHKLKHTTFKIDRLENGMSVLEENTKIKPDEEYDATMWYALNDVIYNSKDDLNSAFVKIMGNKRISGLPPRQLLSITVLLTNQGKPSEVSYYLSDDTGLTLEELDQLTVFIKDNIRVKMPVVPGNKIATFSSVILFDRLPKN